ncbi:MAG TPA: GntR family transcriptional regulator [Stellaceae bacterium]|nr:GntR family transcriptional regulator [Stellaceae bacterium]
MADAVPERPMRESVVESSESLTERAYRELEEQIVTLRLAPGAVVTEASLALRLGIGRTPIREALQRLARERLVVILPRRGVVIAEENLTTQLRLIELRREVERLLARAAARRATPEQRRRFGEIAAGMEEAGGANDDIGFMRLDRAFNLLMLDAAHNEFAAGAMSLMHGLSRRFWYIHYRAVADLPLAAQLHADVARAVAAGEGETAQQASDRLIDYIEAFARAAAAADA